MMAGFLSEEDLAKIKACVLLHKRRELVENVDPRNHLTYLRSKLILDERDCDEIKSARSRQGSAEIFLDILARKGPAGYDEFCKSLLYDETQLFLHTSLTQALSLLRAKVLEDKAKLQQGQQAWRKSANHRQGAKVAPSSPKQPHPHIPSPPSAYQPTPQTVSSPPPPQHPHQHTYRSAFSPPLPYHHAAQTSVYPPTHPHCQTQPNSSLSRIPSQTSAPQPPYFPPQTQSQPLHHHLPAGNYGRTYPSQHPLGHAPLPPGTTSQQHGAWAYSPQDQFQQPRDLRRRCSEDSDSNERPCGESLGFVPTSEHLYK